MPVNQTTTEVVRAPAPEELLAGRLAESAGLAPGSIDALASQWRQLREEFTRFRLYYQFGIEEVLTKVNILRQEFENTTPTARSSTSGRG